MNPNAKLILIIVLFAFLLISLNIYAQIEVPFKGEFPIAMTNPGQSPEIAIVGLLARRANIEITSENFLKPEKLEGVKTLIIILGGSGKGLGAAGVNIDAEVLRAKELIQVAKEKEIKIIGMHLGGKERRGEASMIMINLITPECDYVVVREDGNEDGYFTKLCEQYKVPLTLIAQTNQASDILKAIFIQEEETEEKPS